MITEQEANTILEDGQDPPLEVPRGAARRKKSPTFTSPNPLRWLGSKKNMLHDLEPYLEGMASTWEPFAGGAHLSLAALAAGRIESAHLGDREATLARFYATLRTDWDACRGWLMQEWGRMEGAYDDSRQQQNTPCPASIKATIAHAKENVRRAEGHELIAHFLLINRTGYNGLLRFNLAGKCNTPCQRYGGISTKWLAKLDALHAALQRCTIANEDALVALRERAPDTSRLLLVDPPYVGQWSYGPLWDRLQYAELHEVLIARAEAGERVVYVNGPQCAEMPGWGRIRARFDVRAVEKRQAFNRGTAIHFVAVANGPSIAAASKEAA